MQVLSRLDLEDHLVADDQVESLMRDLGAVVSDDNIQLPVDTVAALEQFAFRARQRTRVRETRTPALGAPKKKRRSPSE